LKKINLLILLHLFFLNSFCQKSESVNILFDVVFKNNPIVLHYSTYNLHDGNSIKFETLKFYISNIQLFQNEAAVYTEQNSFHLIDVSDASSQNVFLKLANGISFNKIKFNLGIDSTTNVGGAMGGDLDPTKGMYWTWQSGYINFKMEGICNTCTDSKKEFEFHLGGYQYPFNSLQSVELKTTANSFKIILDLRKFFTAVDLKKQKHIMSPCADAVILSQQLAKCFSIK
jgi:hypothetical protein